MQLAFIDKLLTAPNAVYSDVIIIALITTGVVLLLHGGLSMMRGKTEPRQRWGWWSRLVYLGTITGVGILGVTSLYSTLAHGHMEEWFLLIHLAGAGMFTACLALFALTFAHRHRFAKQAASAEIVDTRLSRAQRSHARRVEKDDEYHVEKTPCPAPIGGITKLTFWLILISGFTTAATMLISMLPILGTHDMEQMLTLHRYAGLMLVVTMVIHFYLVMMGRLGRG